MADETAVLLNIGDMIDLAIGSPEVGVVDFGMLHTVLHCLAQQLRVSEKNVELRGNAGALPVGRTKAHTVTVSEFIVDTEEKDPAGKMVKKTELPPMQIPTNDQETILVVEKKRLIETPGFGAQRTRTPPPITNEASPLQPIGSTEKLSLVTISKFNILENTVEDLKNRVYGSIPKNEDILEEVRSQTNLKAITDMWTSLNVSSRLEATEAGLAKLSSLVQDIITDTTGLQEELKSRPSITPSVLPRPSTAPAPSAVPSTVPSSITPQPQITAPDSVPSSKKEIPTMQSQIDRLRGDLDNLTNTLYTALGDQIAGLAPPAQSQAVSQMEAPSPQLQAPTQQAQVPTQQLQMPSPQLQSSDTPSKPTPTPSDRRQSEYPKQTSPMSNAMIAEIMERINDLEKRLNKCCESIGKNDGVIQDQANSFQDQLEYLTKQVASLTEILAAGKMSPNLTKDLQGLMTLFQTVQEMQEQLKQVHNTALQLATEKEDRQYHMNVLLEQIELLKTVKLDREDMIEAMADKADMRMLARKVSHDQFELACDDLSRGLEHALGKLNMQEALWQQALDDIQREIEMKLDKMELSPVKDFFNNKLRQLQDNLKQMASLRREVEAAGTKRRLLRDVNCISCDANAVMPTEPPSTVPVLRPLQANISMKPYLSYELDAIRKTQATNVPQRNLHDWENIDKQMAQQKPPQKIRSETGKHICNRYCGGSHTVTTAMQRVARLGHFMKQWGPDVVPLSSGLAAGDDGRMYKVSTVEGANVGSGGVIDTCTPKPKKIDQPKTPQRPMTAQECRCMDGD
ncbi:autophagy-related protein 23-like [Vanessa atalanta]|uniref:autophagy-related protein 23-like n=1 Tax=Vanessa atalanta TaxID=42275 RepID=UPI001FCDE13F|nr:autophagy-related protein 23-like [Vanessa atalanta]